jgi:hypothetical protein
VDLSDLAVALSLNIRNNRRDKGSGGDPPQGNFTYLYRHRSRLRLRLDAMAAGGPSACSELSCPATAACEGDRFGHEDRISLRGRRAAVFRRYEMIRPLPIIDVWRIPGATSRHRRRRRKKDRPSR